MATEVIQVRGASEHNLQNIDVEVERGKVTVVTGVSGSGKSSLAFDTILAESQRRFFYTLSHYSRQFLDLGSRPAVKSVTGLSPAISLAQNETQPSKRASVGTLTDVTELLGVLMARFGSQSCPKHGKPTSSLDIKQLAPTLVEQFSGETVAICAPLAEDKKGTFRKQMQEFGRKGYLRAYVNGDLVPLTPIPELDKDKRHTIKIVVDSLKLDPKKFADADPENKALTRLLRSMETALTEGAGFAEYYVAEKAGSGRQLNLERGGVLSKEGGCETCGFSWGRLDARHFSPNSLGRCKICNGLGNKGDEEDETEEERLGLLDQCPACDGTGINGEVAAIKLAGKSVQEIQNLSLEEVQKVLSLKAVNPAMQRLTDEITQSLSRLAEVGLNYLNLARRIRTLSAGEAQRLKLAGILGENLRGILYVLDEPSQGLHPSELERLWESLEHLKSQGNTIIIVDHDESLMRRADWIIDLGPGGGQQGGKLQARFKPDQAEAFASISKTAANLVGADHEVPKSRQAAPDRFIEINGARAHNLQIKKAQFPRGRLTAVTGVSGAGKSSLILQTLYPNLVKSLTAKRRPSSWRYCDDFSGDDGFETVHLVDRKPIAKSSVSMPASYLDIFTDIRNLFAKIPEAQIAGLNARSFSLSVEAGRCPECKGRGEVSLKMRFLADARVRCTVCHGERYRPHVLGVRYRDKTITDVLNMSIGEAAEFFTNHKKISGRLKPALELGLDYLKLGQPSASLSGGESQRLKIVPFLSKRHGEHSLLILDEPTTGLHRADALKLIQSLHRLVVLGATVVVIEHAADMIQAADWVIDLGPGSASEGGRLLYQGPPSKLAGTKTSVTARYL